jgi:isopentenyl-diphosphate Delta-isomerase
MDSISEIITRKQSHFELCANHNVEFRTKTTLFEDLELVHQPMTETSLDELDLSVTLLGKRLAYPFLITGMTGGADEIGRFNREIAALAERLGVGFGVGSQRVMLRQPELVNTFSVRDVAPNVLLFGNIGLAQAPGLTREQIVWLTDSIGADALCVHMNTAMEIIQDNGDRDFHGAFEGLSRAVYESNVPIIVKETGCGFARESGIRVHKAGVRWVDVAGAGGTSWVGVETIRNRALRSLGEAFWDWGTPTAASLCELGGLDLNLIASGGIRTGLQAAKALSLGAKAVGMALPIVRAYMTGGVNAVETTLHGFFDELRVAMMLCGARRVRDLTPGRVVIGGRLLNWIEQRQLQLPS